MRAEAAARKSKEAQSFADSRSLGQGERKGSAFQHSLKPSAGTHPGEAAAKKSPGSAVGDRVCRRQDFLTPQALLPTCTARHTLAHLCVAASLSLLFLAAPALLLPRNPDLAEGGGSGSWQASARQLAHLSVETTPAHHHSPTLPPTSNHHHARRSFLANHTPSLVDHTNCVTSGKCSTPPASALLHAGARTLSPPPPPGLAPWVLRPQHAAPHYFPPGPSSNSDATTYHRPA